MVYVDHGFVQTLQGTNGKGVFQGDVAGTLNYCGPEMLLKQDYKGRDVDIFSLGVNLFLLMTRMPPWRYAVRNDPYYKYILADQIDMFWKKQTDRMRKEDDPSYEFDPDFKDLFLQMTTPNPQERIKLCDIIGHPWVTKNCASD